MPGNKPHIRTICFDLGDTIMIEETEVKDATETTQRADLIPGMPALLRDLEAQAFPLALVADGKVPPLINVLQQHKLLNVFDALAISKVVGINKPAPAMFERCSRPRCQRWAWKQRTIPAA